MQLLRDLADPAEGIYNATSLLGERLSYITTMLNKYEKLPVRAPTSSTVLGTSIPASSLEDALRGSSSPARDADGGAEPGAEGEEGDAGEEGGPTGVTAALRGVTAALPGVFAPEEPAPAPPAALAAVPAGAPSSDAAERREVGNVVDAPAGSAAQRPADMRPALRRSLTRVSSLDDRSAVFHWPRPASRAVGQRQANTVR